jgi:hypothetical protein
MHKFATALLGVLFVAGSLPQSSLASSFQTAKVRRIVEGKEVYIDKRQAKVNQEAKDGQQISTGSSRAELLFDKRALGFIGKQSLITLGRECFRLQQGTVLVNGTQKGCLGSKILGVRGTTYVLSTTENGNFELSVLHGDVSVDEAGSVPADAEKDVDILSLYPTLSPWIGFGPSAWGSNTGGLKLGEAAGLILGDLDFFLPIAQNNAKSLLYSYTTASTNFDGAWGASTEIGYTWFDPNNQSSTTLFLGYDGWNSLSVGPSCFNNQLALGGQWQRDRWQFGLNGNIPIASCPNSLSLASARIGVPIVDLGDQSITLSFSPYVVNGAGSTFGGGQIGLDIPIGDHLQASAYAQYDDLLDTVVGGRITYRFATSGKFVRDPNIPPSGSSVIPQLSQGAPNRFNTGKPFQIALGQSAQSQQLAFSNPSSGDQVDAVNPLLVQAEQIQIKAGEKAVLSPSGQLISVGKLSKDEYSQLVISNMSGQDPLPEGHAIIKTYSQLYEAPSLAMMSATGFNWLISSRQPYPRARADQNLVVPDNKLEGSSSGSASGPGLTANYYVCAAQSGATSLYYASGLSGFTTVIQDAITFPLSGTPSCSFTITTPGGTFTTSPVLVFQDQETGVITRL